MTEIMQTTIKELSKKELTENQIRGIKILSLTCHATEKQLKEIMGERDYKDMRERGLLEKVKATKFEGVFQTTLKLSEKGYKEMHDEKISKVSYRSKAKFHNLHMTKHLIQKPNEVLWSAITEGQGKYEMGTWLKSMDNIERPLYEVMKKRGKISVPDLQYKENGQLVYFEVSNDYKREEIKAKHRYAEIRGAKHIFEEIGEMNLRKVAKLGEEWWNEKE